MATACRRTASKATGAAVPDRDAQSDHIKGRAAAFQRGVDPVVSVDTKKKEPVRDFRNSGRERRPNNVIYFVFDSQAHLATLSTTGSRSRQGEVKPTTPTTDLLARSGAAG